MNIRYDGVHPSHETKQHVESMVREIYDEAPYGAVIDVSFADRRGSVKGIMQIHSSAGAFFASAESNDFNEIISSLAHQMRKRLKKWKDNRYKHEREHNPSVAS